MSGTREEEKEEQEEEEELLPFRFPPSSLSLSLLFFYVGGISFCAGPGPTSAPLHLVSLTVSHCIVSREPDRAGVENSFTWCFRKVICRQSQS